MDLLNNLKACTGCTACANICAKGAITMVPNELGFLYPSVDFMEFLVMKTLFCQVVQEVLFLNWFTP